LAHEVSLYTVAFERNIRYTSCSQSFPFMGVWKREKNSKVEDYHINNSPFLMAVTSLGDTITKGQLLATHGY